jgi:PAS domain S-box-containing protein
MVPLSKPAAGDLYNLIKHLADAQAALNNLHQLCLQEAFNPAEAAIDNVQDAFNQLEHNLGQLAKHTEPVTLPALDIEQLYTAIFDHSPYALSLTKMPEGTLVSVNEAFLKLFGFSRQAVIGKTSVELEISDAASRTMVAEEFQKYGAVHELECTRKKKNGELLTLSISLSWINLGGEKYVITTIRDLTDTKLAEQALEATHLQADSGRKRLQAVMEALPVGVAILDAHGGNLEANHAFELVWGGPRPQVSSVEDYTIFKAWWADSDQPVKPEEWASAQAVQKGLTVTGQVMKIQKFNGTFAYIHNNAAPIFDAQGNIAGCAVAIQEITQFKQREEEISRLNRTLRALSDSNQAMLHASDEQSFLVQVCQLIVQNCDFSMVWIGYAEDDQQKSVRPVASAGFEQGYLDSMQITWADTERGNGPTGTAIRARQPARCNNMLTDPKFAPWREAALRNGYASSIVLPLISGDKAFGALNIYSKEPNGFSAEEEKLLVELAGDLAFGITTMRLKASHAYAEQALRESEERYRSLFDNMTEGFALHEIICNEDGTPCDYRFLEINPAFERLVGLSRSQAIGKLASQVIPDLEAEWIEIFGSVALTGKPVRFERLILSQGKYYVIYVYRPAPRLFAAIFTDITAQKQAELQLRQVAEKYSSLFNTTTDGVYITNLEGVIQEVNNAYCEMSGYSRDELTNMHVSQLEASETSEEIVIHTQKVLNQKGHDRFESKHRRKDGSIFDVDITALHLNQDGGRIAIFTRDITERKLAEQALRQARNELEQKVQQRTLELSNANNQLRLEVEERQKAQEDLETNLQEMQVLEEELRNNNEMLEEAQQVLDSERQRYQDLFDFAPDGYLVTDCDGLVIEANQVADQMLEIPHQSLIGKPLIVFIAEQDRHIFNHLLTSLRHQSDNKSHELNLLPRKGSQFTTAVRVVSGRDRNGKETLRWIVRDITERKRNEKLIRQNSERNALLSEIGQLLADASLDETTILNIVAKTTARLIGDSCVITYISEDGHRLNPMAWHHASPAALKLINSLYALPQYQIDIGPYRKVFKSVKPLLISSTSAEYLQGLFPEGYRPYLDQVGITSLIVVPLKVGTQVIGTVGLSRDQGGKPYTDGDLSVAERIASRAAQSIQNARLHQELQDALQNERKVRDQLVQAEKFAAVGRLLASITHEINNPLQTIKNCLYLSQADTPPNTPLYDTLSMAQSETNRLSNLVAQLREIYRPPTMSLHQPVNLPDLLDETHTLLVGYLQEKHTTWKLNPPQPDVLNNVIVEGVADQLKQVFLNILLNAMDAMEPDGGRITISLLRSADGKEVGISFQDSGPGITQEVKDKLFEPFSTTKEKGLGLGLVICYDIIQKHAGHIEVTSKPGEGATFTTWLPVRQYEA